MKQPPNARRTLTVELVAELPLLALPAPHQPSASAAPDEAQSLRIQTVLDSGNGQDAWTLPLAADAVPGERCGGDGSPVARYCATMSLDAQSPGVLLRCQVLHAGTAGDESGHHWNVALHPTEELLVAIEVERETAIAGAAEAPPPRLPVPKRARHAGARPGVHLVRLQLNADGQVSALLANEWGA